MKKESYLKIFVLLLSFVFVLSACGGTAPEPEAAEEEAPAAESEEMAEEEMAEEEAPAAEEAMSEKVEIEIWQNQGDFTACIEENIVAAFNAQSDSIVVNSVTFESAWDSTRTAVAGGEGPDIIRSPGPSFVFEMVQANQLLSLEEFSNVYGWSDSVAEFALNLGQVDGELYSLPDEMETLVVYYNKNVFEDNGWEVPTTVDELHALAAEIDAAGIIPFTHANAEWRPANEWHVGNYLNHVAGPDKVHAALTGDIEWTDPDFIKAIELLDEAQQNSWYMGGLEFYYTTTFDDLHTALGTGEGAMNIEGTWAASGINDTWFTEETGGNEWGWFPMPSSNGDTIFDLGMGNTSSINAATENPQAAAEYLNYYFSADVQATAFTECGKAPAPVVIPEGTITGIDSRIADIFESMSAAVASGGYGYTTWTFFPPKTDVYIYEEIEKVWSGDITAEEYMVGLNDLFQEELAAGDIPPIPAR